jgi:hypothetical protein
MGADLMDLFGNGSRLAGGFTDSLFLTAQELILQEIVATFCLYTGTSGKALSIL